MLESRQATQPEKLRSNQAFAHKLLAQLAIKKIVTHFRH